MLGRSAALVTLGCAIASVSIMQMEAQGVASASHLFDSPAAPLRLRLETDLRALLRDRGDERVDHPGMLRYDAASDTGSLEVKLRTRGIFRLKHCGFPPLRLDLTRRRVAATPFAGEDKLKLVTHCQSDRSSERNLLQEFVLYRVFNALTDTSFRARLVHVAYVDTSRKADTLSRYAFLLESDMALAHRFGAEVEKRKTVHDLLIDPMSMTLVAVFQYLIGNTDWSVWGQHNIAILHRANGTLLAVPYDFDFSGAVAAPYATPPPQLPIRSVRERLYRGYCQPDSVLTSVLARFRMAKDSIYAVVRAVPELGDRDARNLLDYFDDFYETLENPGMMRRTFVRGCRTLPQ